MRGMSDGGGGGIRTHGPEDRDGGFQDRSIKPLSHPSDAILLYFAGREWSMVIPFTPTDR